MRRWTRPYCRCLLRLLVPPCPPPTYVGFSIGCKPFTHGLLKQKQRVSDLDLATCCLALTEEATGAKRVLKRCADLVQHSKLRIKGFLWRGVDLLNNRCRIKALVGMESFDDSCTASAFTVLDKVSYYTHQHRGPQDYERYRHKEQRLLFNQSSKKKCRPCFGF